MKYDIDVAFIEQRDTKIIGPSINFNSRKILWVHIGIIKCSLEKPRILIYYGSTDINNKIYYGYKRKDSRIKVIHINNMGK